MLFSSTRYLLHVRPPLKAFRLSLYPSKMDVLRTKMSSLAPHGKKHKVTVVGSGNWYTCSDLPFLQMLTYQTGVP